MKLQPTTPYMTGLMKKACPALAQTPARLAWHKVINNRHQPAYGNCLMNLWQQGLDYPFVVTPDIQAEAKQLLMLHRPTSQLSAALTFMRSLHPPQATVLYNGTDYPCFTHEEGGMQISADPLWSNVQRYYYGIASPDLMAIGAVSTANCLEFSYLLMTLLRGCRIEVGLKVSPNHAYLISRLDGTRYKLDAGLRTIEQTAETPLDDASALAYYYANKGFAYLTYKQAKAALPYLVSACFLSPDLAEAWSSRSIALKQLGRTDEAIACCSRAIKLNPGCLTTQELHIELLLHKARSFAELRQFQPASAVALAVLRQDANRQTAWRILAATALFLEDKKEILDYCHTRLVG